MTIQREQRLHWSISKPLRWLGLTLDEWGILLGGMIPGLFMVNSTELTLGLTFIISSCTLCYGFKKFKKVSEYFLLKKLPTLERAIASSL